jgi:limonene-1,2-epoxide hydrolase
MVFNFLRALKEEVGEDNFEIILDMTEVDIKFNRVGFGKTTGPAKFIEICTGCKNALMRYQL